MFIRPDGTYTADADDARAAWAAKAARRECQHVDWDESRPETLSLAWAHEHGCHDPATWVCWMDDAHSVGWYTCDAHRRHDKPMVPFAR